MKRIITLALILLLTVACGSTNPTDPPVEGAATEQSGQPPARTDPGLSNSSENQPGDFTSFSYTAKEAMGFCPGNFLEVFINRSAPDKFLFSATLVKEVNGSEGQPCLQTGRDGCLISEELPRRVLDKQEALDLLATFSRLAFASPPDWCQDLHYEPCLIESYQWHFAQGQPMEIRGDICYEPHLSEADQAALQQLFLNLAAVKPVENSDTDANS